MMTPHPTSTSIVGTLIVLLLWRGLLLLLLWVRAIELVLLTIHLPSLITGVTVLIPVALLSPLLNRPWWR